MKIKQVEELVNITGKNIRFYEEQGLLTPARSENGYRDYGLEEVARLKKIKLLRKFRVPVEDIKQVLDRRVSLAECLEAQSRNLEAEAEALRSMQGLVGEMLKTSPDIDTLDPDTWLAEVEKQEKEGIDFVDLSKIDIHMKKKAGAIGGGVVMIALMVIAIIAVAVMCHSDPYVPGWVLPVFTGFPALVIVCVLVAMISRVKEINGGEEDEAAKY